jgi:hypothetical protein
MVAAGAGALATPAPGRASRRAGTSPAAAPADGGRVFTLGIGTVNGASPVVTAGRGFVLAGVQWARPAAARIQMRARARGGRWSPWALASVRGHEPDRPSGSSRAQFGEPLWFGRCDQVQVRSSGPVGGVRLHCVAEPAMGAETKGGSTAGSASAPPLVAVNLPAGPGQPPIISRSAWAGRRDGPAGGPFYGSVQLAFVHHTENPNGYSPGQVPPMLRAMYDYHRFTRGYYDIAYNFVIDAFGRIWEARAGGVDQPVRGAHAGGFNGISTGIAILGSFTSSVPPPPALDALQRLLAWKLALHGVPAVGKVRVEVNPSDAFYTPFAPGQRVLLPRVAGHRDGDRTSCPGDDLYARLPSIRPAVSSLAGVPAQLTLTASATTLPFTAPVTLSGRLTRLDGSALPGAALRIQSVRGIGVTADLATVTTAADGTWTATVTLPRSEVVRALSDAAPAAVSNLVAIGVVPAITLGLLSSSPLRVAGAVNPPTRHVTLTVSKLAGSHRRVVLTRTVPVRLGRFNARLRLPRPARGNYVIVARTTTDSVLTGGASAPLAFSR